MNRCPKIVPFLNMGNEALNIVLCPFLLGCLATSLAITILQGTKDKNNVMTSKFKTNPAYHIFLHQKQCTSLRWIIQTFLYFEIQHTACFFLFSYCCHIKQAWRAPENAHRQTWKKVYVHTQTGTQAHKYCRSHTACTENWWIWAKLPKVWPLLQLTNRTASSQKGHKHTQNLTYSRWFNGNPLKD